MTEPDPRLQGLGSSDGTVPIETVLRRLHRTSFTGRLIGFGAAGVTIHLQDGLVTALDTPTAPGPESLLLKSGRVTQTDWAKAVDYAADNGTLAEILVSGSLVGAGELDVVRTAALFDGAFTASLGARGRWQTEPADPATRPVLPLLPGVAPDLLIAETTRRFAVLARLWGPASQLARSRPVPKGRAAHAAAAIIPRHAEILLSINGRRNPRDVAFALGRGVFAVMADISRMAALGLVEIEERTTSGTLPSLAPRKPGPALVPGATPAVNTRLPRRTSRAAAQAEGMTPPDAGHERARSDGGLFQRLRGTREPAADQEPPQSGGN